MFSDLSGFSKLCESYVEKYSGNDSQVSMSQAAEKLNVGARPHTSPLACTTGSRQAEQTRGI